MKFEDVRVGDVFDREGQAVALVTYKSETELHYIYNDGAVGVINDSWCKLVARDMDIISRNKTVTVSVS